MKINKEISWIENEEEFYLIDIVSNKCVIIDSTGKKIWDYVLKFDTIESIIEHLQLQYSKEDSDRIAQDVRDFCNMLISLGILSDYE